MAVMQGWFSDRVPLVRGVGAGYSPPFSVAHGVAFDGSIMLHGLPTSVNDANWALSTWVNFGTLGVAVTPDPSQGVFFRTNTLTDGTVNFLQITPNMSETDALGLGIRIDDEYTFLGSGYSSFPAAWAWLGASCKIVLNLDATITVTRVVYINDTEVINDTHTFDPGGADGTIDWANGDSTDLDGLHAACIGAKYLTLGTGDSDRTDPTPSGTGLKCGLAEYWQDKRFVDWANSTNRGLFRSLSGGAYHPISLGSDGSAPFSSAPISYYTGDATTFLTNRGAGGGTLSTAGGGTLYSIAGPT